MLNLYSPFEYDLGDVVFHVDKLYDNLSEVKWLADPLVQKMIMDIDKTKVIADELLLSPVFGYIAPSRLSTGVKGLILLAKCDELKDRYFLSSMYGNNCYKWVFLISTFRDFKMIVDSWFNIPEDCDKTKTYEVNFVDLNYTTSDPEDIWYTMYDL